MINSSEVSYIKAPNHLETVKYPDPSVIAAVYNAATKTLSELTQSMFDAIDDSLFELANNARSNNEQNRFFEAMREVRIKRQSIESNFQQQVKSLFEPKAVLTSSISDPTTENAVKDNLSLVGESEMELNIAISSMASKSKSNLQKALLDTQHCFGQLYGAKTPELVSSPLEPAGICRCFSESCNSLEVDIKEQLLILKQFDRFVMTHFDEVLNVSLQKLAEAKFSPPKKHAASAPIIRNNQRGTQSSRSSEHSSNSDSSKNRNQNSDQPRAYENFEALLARFQHHSGNTNTHQASYASSATAEMQKALSVIQRTLHGLDEKAQVNLNNLVGKELSLTGAQLSQYDNDLIRLVSMLFEFILQDNNLAPSMQALISRMQIPILKVVIQDSRFFSSNTHPARHLLNSLAKAGISWTETQRKDSDPLYAKLKQIVSRTLAEFDGDLRLLKILDQDLNQFLSQEERKASIVEQRTREAEEGRIRSIQAQEKVELTLHRQILSAHHSIPEFIIDTLKNGWSRVMFLAYLKDDQEHQWSNTVDISKELIWCLQPLTAPKDRQRWISVVPKLLKDLEAGLRNVSYNSANIDQTISAIKTELTTSFKDSSYAQATSKKPKTGNGEREALKPSDIKSNDTYSTEKENNVLAKHIEKANALKVGQWVEFKLVNGDTHRCKLSANIKEADCFIFVNRMGLKPIKKSLIELAQDLQKNRVIFLEQGLMIDRALSSFASNLLPNQKN